MKKILILFIFLLALPLPISAQAAQKKAIYFYSDACPHCVRVDRYFTDGGIYAKYEIQKVQADTPENFDKLNQFFKVFGVPSDKRGYPVIFFDAKMIIGDQPIIDNFVNEIESVDASISPDLQTVKKNLEKKSNTDQQQAAKAASSVPVPLLIGAALVDASNPCALAVLILLLATVIAAKGKNSALLAGLLFSLAIFISYFLMGIGVYKVISAFSLPKYFSLVIGALSIIIGLANLKDVFWPGKLFVMEVPLSWRPRLRRILKSVTSPIGAFGVGFLVSLFLVPCASGPYVVILGLLAGRINTTQTLALLILYNLVFVLPMFVITFAMYFLNTRMGKLEVWRKNYNWLLHSIAGAVMLFIGAYLIYGWLK